MLPMPTAPVPLAAPSPTEPTERQLVLPLELVSGPPPAPLPPLGPALPPRRVWRSLSRPMQEEIRRALLHVCQHLTPVTSALTPVTPALTPVTPALTPEGSDDASGRA